MRIILLPLLLLSSFNCIAQPGIHFRDVTLPQALSLSDDESKPVFFMAFASWCTHCKNMKEQVFTDSSVANFYNSHFICMEMDMEKDDGVELKKKLGISSFPTFVFLDSTGKTIYQVLGEFKAADFIEQGKNALTPEKQLPHLKQQFESNPSDSDKCYKYLLALRRGGLDVQALMNRYFAENRGQQLLTPLNWKILNMGVSDIQTSQFQFLIDHRKEYGAIVTTAKVDRKIFRTVAYSLQPLADNNDTSNYFRERKIAAGLHLFSIDSLAFNLDLMLFENNNRWLAYQAEALQFTEQYDWNDYAQLRHIADAFLKNVRDAEGLKEAAKWARRSAEIKEEYGNTLLYARLLAKIGNRPDAILAVERAKAIAVKTNSSTSEADELLKQINQ